MTQRRRPVKIVIPLSELLKLESSPAPMIPARVAHPAPKIDWITIIGCTCMIVITVAAVWSALRQKKSTSDRGYGA